MDICFQPVELDSLPPENGSTPRAPNAFGSSSRAETAIQHEVGLDFAGVLADLALEEAVEYPSEDFTAPNAFGSLVGQSAAVRAVIKQVDLVAPTEASVLILGETGTGKELVAQEIHQRSGRKNKALVRVNCASIPRELENQRAGWSSGTAGCKTAHVDFQDA